jgi:hypothetical protein
MYRVQKGIYHPSSSIIDLSLGRAMKTKTNVQLESVLLRLDPALIRGINALRQVGMTQTVVFRDALYTAVYAALRDGVALREAPRPFPIQSAPHLRVLDAGFVRVDEYGLQIEQPVDYLEIMARCAEEKKSD